MFLEALEPSAEGEPEPPGLPGPLLAELTALYRSDPVFQRISGGFPDPDDIRPEHVAAGLAEELVHPSRRRSRIYTR